MNSTRNRKGQTSITHLMNFALPPRPANATRHARRLPSWTPGSGHHAVDKARYVHANFRFIVDPRQDYHAQNADADVYIDWPNVLQVLASPQSQPSACPICLGEPVAPRMTKCGHIFCCHCLIRYMHSDDEARRWKRCPICEDAISVSEARPLRWYIGQEPPPPKANEDVVLRLVARPPGSTLALPKDNLINVDDVPWHSVADVMDFARIMRGSEDYMVHQYNRELADIEQLEKHDEILFGEDPEWTHRASRTIRNAIEHTTGIGNSARFPDSRSEGDSYLFYQALHHYYLSPLDIRILKTAFGDYSAFPSTLLPRVDHVSTGHVVDDDLRKRAKYLSHLPKGCEVAFLECDWTDIVPTETLELFRADLDKRRRRNEEKEQIEEKARLRAEAEDDRRYTSARRSRPTSSLQLTSEDFEPLTIQDANATVEATTPTSSHALGSRTVWGTAAFATETFERAEEESMTHTSENTSERWFQGWDSQVHRTEAISPALSGRKKQGKKITLMSNNARRGA